MVPVQDCPSLFTWKIPPVKQGSFHPGPAVPRRQCYQCQDGSAISAKTTVPSVPPVWGLWFLLFVLKDWLQGFAKKLLIALSFVLVTSVFFWHPPPCAWVQLWSSEQTPTAIFFRFFKIGWRKRNRREENSASLENVFVQKKILDQKKFQIRFFGFFCQIQISDEIFDSVERLSGWTFIGGLHNCGLDKFVLPQTVLIKPS